MRDLFIDKAFNSKPHRAGKETVVSVRDVEGANAVRGEHLRAVVQNVTVLWGARKTSDFY